MPGRSASLLPYGVLLVLLVLPAGWWEAQAQERGERVRFTVNDGWRYAPAEAVPPGAADPALDDAGWEVVDLPHTWNARDAFDKEPGYRRGVGWYRKRLVLDPSLAGRRLFLYFEGANQVADVYVNGLHVGSHVGGYTAFAFDITAAVTFDRPSLVAVRVDNRHDDDIPPLDADFTFYGGIYRDVWLLATDPVHFDVLDYAGPGVYVDTPLVTGEAATVRVRGTVVNAGAAPAAVEVVSRVREAGGREVAVLRSTVQVPPGGRAPFEQVSDTLSAPRLWSPADPYLYHVEASLYTGTHRRDVVVQPLGFRWLRVDPQLGVFLNGQPIRLFGTNRHQDLPGLGNALPDAAHRRDVEIVKENGFNFLRLAHYPQDPAVLEAADRLGLVVWEEIPVVNMITRSEAFYAHAERMLVEMIRQHYNHPSVLFWGYMNEILLRETTPVDTAYRADVVALARRLEARAKAEDPTRHTVTAISHGEVNNGSGFQDIPDVLGLNLYFGWYYGTFADLGAFLDTLHARHPARPLMVSEYGAGSDERVHTTGPVPFDFSSEHQQAFHRESFAQLQARPYLAGTAVWNQFDFGSALRQDTKNALNQKGLYFFDRTPKDIAFYYRARLRDEPVLYIAREWSRRAGSRPEDRRQPVWVYANTDSVELLVDGISQGWQPVVNATARWLVNWSDGMHRLEARGWKGGGPVVDVAHVAFEDRTGFFEGRGPAVLAVNAGAHEAYTDGSGVVWEPDRPYAPGGWGHVGGTARRTHHRITSTADDPLFQTYREGVQAYRFDVPDGRYRVTLGFMEAQHETPAQRVFGVRAGSRPLLAGLDLAAGTGRWRATTRTADVVVTGGTGLVLTFEAGAGAPVVSSILLERR
ncbi:DUF4982 domain-containing protein [Rhodocaloribacter litoris]|uniref:glycoside hydrolase family 2 TIM barrel-domain containing protein n=1 Tax=Rhodocaloribacter litoris TaxID=2558931 RepID=UPI0014240163|nr:glycoside hydrolase family 2 TIM barrel-domain containing protein [Rhodocaloribacter litoris]QXD15153.1 DUF4982 domain-containing protein [Rhodocaloribacter litoris]